MFDDTNKSELHDLIIEAGYSDNTARVALFLINQSHGDKFINEVERGLQNGIAKNEIDQVACFKNASEMDTQILDAYNLRTADIEDAREEMTEAFGVDGVEEMEEQEYQAVVEEFCSLFLTHLKRTG